MNLFFESFWTLTVSQLRNEKAIHECWPPVLLNTFTRERYFQFDMFPLGMSPEKKNYTRTPNVHEKTPIILFRFSPNFLEDIYSALQTKFMEISQRIINIWKDGLVVSCYDGCELFIHRLIKEVRRKNKTPYLFFFFRNDLH